MGGLGQVQKSVDAPRPVGRLHHLGISVRSLDRSLSFYRDLLGFTEVHNVTSRAEYLSRLLGHPEVQLRVAMVSAPADRVSIELLEYNNVSQVVVDHDHVNPGIAHLALQVSDVDGVYQRLRAAGVEAVSAPVTPTAGPNAGSRIVYLIDPDGVRVELISPGRESAGSGEAAGEAPENTGQYTTGDAVDVDDPAEHLQ